MLIFLIIYLTIGVAGAIIASMDCGMKVHEIVYMDTLIILFWLPLLLFGAITALLKIKKER